MGHSKAGSQPHTAGAAADALVYRDARLLAGQLAAGSLSAREVMTAFLQRIEACNPVVNAICTLLPAEQALALADAADRQRLAGAATGPLHGLPIAVKDLAATRGMRTTMGSPIFADNIPEEDSLLVQRLRAAGALVIGKTNTPEFGTGSHTFNPLFGITRNPWNTGKSAGGSSGGAAAALACGMLPLADGSDMGGSLRNPAAFCNVVGFRPSLGRVPHWPNTMAWQSRLGVEGPMARTVADCALLLSVLAGPDERDPLSIRRVPRSSGRAWNMISPGPASAGHPISAFYRLSGRSPRCAPQPFPTGATAVSRSRRPARTWRAPWTVSRYCAPLSTRSLPGRCWPPIES